MILAYALLSYLFGAIPTGYIIFHITEKKDIRRFGSHATGATNVLRLKGWKHGILVGLADAAKGFLPVIITQRFVADERISFLCGFLAVLGHCFPVFIKFRGGKGVATAAGVYLAMAPLPALLGAAIFLTFVSLTRYVSLGSLLAMLSFPFSIWLFSANTDAVIMSGSIFCLIFLRHRANIQRLITGDESKLGEKSA